MSKKKYSECEAWKISDLRYFLMKQLYNQNIGYDTRISTGLLKNLHNRYKNREFIKTEINSVRGPIGSEMGCLECRNKFIRKSHMHVFCCDDCRIKYYNRKRREKGLNFTTKRAVKFE